MRKTRQAAFAAQPDQHPNVLRFIERARADIPRGTATSTLQTSLWPEIAEAIRAALNTSAIRTETLPKQRNIVCVHF
jgi:hypothetical protein